MNFKEVSMKSNDWSKCNWRIGVYYVCWSHGMIWISLPYFAYRNPIVVVSVKFSYLCTLFDPCHPVYWQCRDPRQGRPHMWLHSPSNCRCHMPDMAAGRPHWWTWIPSDTELKHHNSLMPESCTTLRLWVKNFTFLSDSTNVAVFKSSCYT